MKKTALILVIIILAGLGGWYWKQAGRSGRTGVEQGIGRMKPVPLENLDDDKTFTLLTQHSWCNRSEKPAMLSEYMDYAFKSDGTYSKQLFTDYTTKPETGKWNFTKDTLRRNVLVFDDGSRKTFALNRDDTLTLEGGTYHACNPLVKAPGTREDLFKISSPGEGSDKVTALTGTKWKRANDLDLNWQPTLVEFRPDMSYVTTYRNSECSNKGAWYMKDDGTVHGDSPSNPCDQRDPKYAERINASFVDEGKLLFNYHLYVPEKAPQTKGVVWAIFGYHDTVATRVEYDMPIRNGVPNKFTVTIRNTGKEEGGMILQRFSATGDYVRGYRRSDGTIAPVPELGGKDLENKTISAGQEHSFDLYVTFPSSGKQTFYLNTLIRGKTQNWDSNGVYSVEVRE